MSFKENFDRALDQQRKQIALQLIVNPEEDPNKNVKTVKMQVESNRKLFEMILEELLRLNKRITLLEERDMAKLGYGKQ